VERCEARKASCERAFDEDCSKVPQPKNCEPSVRARCDQTAGLCSLDCGSAFRQTTCKPSKAR
jgi:hypothetical protein